MSERVGALRLVESLLLLLPFRLLLGGLFVFAAWVKLSNPQAFAFAIKAFDIIPLESGEHVIKVMTFALPWAEGICGVLLILGLFTRPAAGLLSLQLVVFIGAIVSVLARGMHTECGCFGKYDWPCEGAKITMCHVWRDVAMLVPAVYLTLRGGGVLALDWPRERGGRGPGRAQDEPLD